MFLYLVTCYVFNFFLGWLCLTILCCTTLIGSELLYPFFKSWNVYKLTFYTDLSMVKVTTAKSKINNTYQIGLVTHGHSANLLSLSLIKLVIVLMLYYNMWHSYYTSVAKVYDVSS